MAVVDIIIEIFLGGSDIQFKLNVYSVHNKVAGRICNSVKCAIWNMSIRFFVCEIDELDIKIHRGYNYVHDARGVRLCNVIKFDLSDVDVRSKFLDIIILGIYIPRARDEGISHNELYAKNGEKTRRRCKTVHGPG